MNLDGTLRSYDDTLAKNPSDMPGEIGAVINGKRKTNVIGRGGFVYVRLRTNLSEPIQAYNDKVFPGFGVAVIVRWANNRYEIVGRDSQRYKEWETDSPEISKHGSSHSLDVEGGNIGTDPAWIYPYQLMPGLVSPYNQSGAQNVYVHPFPILYGGEWMYVGNTGTPSLTTYSPTSGTVLILIAMDAETGNPALFASTGSYISWNISGSNSLVPNLPYLDTIRYLPLSFAILQSGTTSMSWDNLRDLRQWMSTSQSGTGGGASLEFQDEGVPLGIPGTVNFVGGNVSVTISGTVARVFVTGSSGGISDHNSLTGLQGGTGSQYYHLGYNEWGGLVTGSLTYLHKHSAVDIVTGTVATARLGSGTADGTTFLRGDQTYAKVIPADGWELRTETWTRTGNHTFTLSGDVTATYRKGTKVRYKDGGSYEYGVIGSAVYSAPNTTVTLITTTDYAMAAATITDTAISYIENPEGFPKYFAMSQDVVTIGNGSADVHWKTKDNEIVIEGVIIFGSTSSFLSTSLTIPITPLSILSSRYPLGAAQYTDAGLSGYWGNILYPGTGNTVGLRVQVASATYLTVSSISSTVPFTFGTSDEISFKFSYLF